MAKWLFTLTGLLVVLMAASRAGTHAGSLPDGPVIPVPLAESVARLPDANGKAQPVTDDATTGASAKPAETVSTIEMPGTAFRLVYLFQYDHGSTAPGAALAKDKPVSVILWKALEVGTKVSPRDVRDRIAENAASPSMTSKVVYALQPDYKIQRLSLSNQDVEHVLALVQAGEGQAIAGDAVWKARVGSQLKEVEWLDDGSHKNGKNKSKDKSKVTKGKTGKVSKVGKSARPGKSTRLTSASARTSRQR